MLTPHPKVIRIAERESRLSGQQKTFNRQIKQIEKLRKQLAAWESITSRYRGKYARELMPLLTALTDMRIGLLRRLDLAMDFKALSPAQRRKLSQAIAHVAAMVLSERDDPAVKEIYNKHNAVDFDSEEAAHAEGVKTFLEDMFDLDLGSADEHDSIDGLFERAKAQFRERQADADSGSHTPFRNKKSRRQLEREEQDAKRVSQSIREVYRKLVSEMHPDRETDPHERARKTELMQRINQAYAKRNLLQLLELQLELEHISEDYVAGLDSERLRHFNAVLKEQIAELKHELVQTETRFRAELGVSPYARLDPETVMHALEVEILAVARERDAIAEDVDLVEDIKGVKAWLKKQSRHPRETDDYAARY